MPIPSTSNVDRALAWGYQAQISDGTTDLLLRLAVAPGRELSITTAPLSAQQINTAQTPEEFRAEFGQSYGRSDFSGGAGLDQAHERQQGPNAAKRFFDSKGIDVFKHAGEKGEAYKLVLHNETELIDDRASTETNQYVITHEDVIYISQGHNIYYSSDSGETWTTADPYAAGPTFDVSGMVLEGHILYVALNDGTDSIIRQLDLDDVPGGWTNYMSLHSSHVYTGLFNVKNYLLAVDTDGHLHELDGTSSPGLIKDLPSGENWVSVEDAGAAILASSDGGYMYAIVDDTTSGLVLSGQTYIEGEEIVDVLETNGIIFFSTAQSSSGGGKIGRLYYGQLSNDGSGLYNVTNRQLLKEFGDDDTAFDNSPTSFFSTRDQIYFGVIENGTETDLYSVFLPTLGYARDIYYTGTTSGLVQGIGVVNDKLFFSISGVGLVKQADTYVTDGYLILAAADFYTAQPKQWVGARLYTDDVPTGTSVKSEYTTNIEDLNNANAASWSVIENIETGQGGEEVAIVNVVSRWLVNKITISTNIDKDETPEIYSYSVRAFPEPEDVIVRMPINVSDKLERPGKRGKTIPGTGLKLFNSLQRLEGKSVTLKVFRPDIIVRGILENVTLPISEITRRGSSTVFCTIQVRGQQITNTLNEVTSLGVLGVGELGIYKWGS